jgi:hypothetical protein
MKRTNMKNIFHKVCVFPCSIASIWNVYESFYRSTEVGKTFLLPSMLHHIFKFEICM